MQTIDDTDFLRVPGLYRLWDLQAVINHIGDYQVHYVELTGDGTPLFAVYRRPPSRQPRPEQGAVQ